MEGRPLGAIDPNSVRSPTPEGRQQKQTRRRGLRGTSTSLREPRYADEEPVPTSWTRERHSRPSRRVGVCRRRAPAEPPPLRCRQVQRVLRGGMVVSGEI